MTLPIVLSLFPTKKIIALDVFSAVFWTYAFFKLFVVDVDRYALQLIAPQNLWLLEFRLIGLAFVALCALIILGRKGVITAAAYLVGFPLILLIWKLPILIVKLGNWVWRIAVLNLILSVFTDVKYRLAYFVVYSASSVLILVVQNNTAATVGVVGLMFCVTSSFIRAFIGAFTPPKVLGLYRHVFDWVQKDTSDSKVTNKASEPLSKLPAEVSKELIQGLQTSVFTNRLCFVFSKRLKEYNNSEVHVIGGIASILWISVLTFLSFSFLYRAAVIMDPVSIESSYSLTAFDYAYIAFDNMFFGTNSSSRLMAFWSQFMSMYQRALSAAIVVIFAAILLEIKRRRHTSEIEKAIGAAEAAAKRVESKVIAEYSYDSIGEAMEDLIKIESSLYAAVVKMLGSISLK